MSVEFKCLWEGGTQSLRLVTSAMIWCTPGFIAPSWWDYVLHAQSPATLQVVCEVSSSSGCELVSWETLVLFFSRNKNKRCLFLSVDETEQEVDRIYSFFTRSYLILAMPLRWRFLKFRAYNGKISSLWTDDHITFIQIFKVVNGHFIQKFCTA